LFFNRLTLDNGLSETTNAYVYQDMHGFVWIGSLSGLNRFDGTSIRKYEENPNDSCSIKGMNIQSPFFEIDSTQLWFNTDVAMNVYNWQTDCFRSYQIQEGDQPLTGYISFYLDAEQNIWLLRENYLYTFNIPSETFNRIEVLDKNCLRAIAIPDQHNNVARVWAYWINKPGVQEIILDSKQHSTDKKIRWESINNQPFTIMDMVSQGDSLLWVLSDAALWKYNVVKNEGRLIPLLQNEATSFDLMDDHTLLIGFKNDGLREFNIQEEKLTTQYLHQPDNPASLLGNNVDGVYKDRSGGLWISSWGKGLSYSQPKKRKFSTFYPKNILPEIETFDPVALVLDKPDVLLCATRTGGFYYLHRIGLEPPEITKIQALNSSTLQGNVLGMIQDDAKNYWICTYPGLSFYEPVSGKIKHISDEEEIANYGIPWHNHNILLCGLGIVEVTGTPTDGFMLERNKNFLDTVSVTKLWMDSKNRLWTCTQFNNLEIYDTTTYRTLAIIPVGGYFPKMIEEDSTIWVSSTGGLFEIDRDSLKVRKTYNKRNGWPTSLFQSMMMDTTGRIWLSSSDGILMFDPIHDHFRFYNQEDGLPPLQFSRTSYQFDDGEIWFAANEGITRFYPDRVHDLDIQAKPQITDIQVNDKIPAEKLICAISGTPNVPLIQKLIFHYKENTLAFRICALEYSSPRRTKVQYQMEGLDNELVEASSGSLIRYPNMPPGDYTFKVYAFNSDGIKNQIPREMIIRIIPPFYKTWLFYTLVALSIIGIVGYIIYLRFSKALELQRVRLKLYENLHDDVGSRLTAIVLSAEDLERNEKINNPKIQSISKIAKSIVENMRRLVWAIDPENDKISTMVQKITHDKSLILGDHISFTIHVDDHLKNVIIPGEIRYQISSICNEAFNNISKYAQATAVTVNLSRDNRKFHLTITDNGKGFDPEATSKNNLAGSGYGLNNMKRRASRVKGNLEIFSKPGEGTRIVADFPY